MNIASKLLWLILLLAGGLFAKPDDEKGEYTGFTKLVI